MLGGVNLYAYVGNDPLNKTDPEGMRDWGIGWGIGAEGHIWIPWIFQKGGGIDTFYCCDPNGKKWRVRTRKTCKGVAEAITGGITFSYVKGKDCPGGYEAEYGEYGFGPVEVGIPKEGWSGITIGYGGGGGLKITGCKYKILEKEIIGCCNL